MYNGKFILRFEDTDPKVKRPSLIFYDSIRQDLKWLGCKVDEEYIQSDRLPIYYEYTEQLIGDGNAYVCECPAEEFHKITLAKQACPCRNLPATEQLERWQRMLNGGYKEGASSCPRKNRDWIILTQQSAIGPLCELSTPKSIRIPASAANTLFGPSTT